MSNAPNGGASASANPPSQAVATRPGHALTVPKEEKEIEYIPFGSDGPIKLSVALVMKYLCEPTKSGRVCSPRDAMKFLMLCQAKGLNPWEGDAFLVGYDTMVNNVVVPKYSLITAHQSLLKRAEVHPEFDGMKSGLILLVNEDTGETVDREGDFHLESEVVIGAWATVFFKTRKYPTHRRLRRSRFDKGFAQWKEDPAGMTVKCCEADSLRSSFPSKIGGLYLREEMDFPINVEAHVVPANPLMDKQMSGLVGEGTASQQAPAPAQATSEPSGEQTSSPEEKKPSEAKPKRTKGEELAEYLVSEGFTFDHFKTWAMETNQIRGIDEMAGFDDVEETDATRLLRNKAGLKVNVKQIKDRETPSQPAA